MVNIIKIKNFKLNLLISKKLNIFKIINLFNNPKKLIKNLKIDKIDKIIIIIKKNNLKMEIVTDNRTNTPKSNSKNNQVVRNIWGP